MKISGYSPGEYLKVANKIVNLTIQIEDIKAADHIDEILSLEGIDMVSSGKADISQSAGIPGQTNDPKVVAMENLIIKKALEHGKQPIILINDKKKMEELLAIGAKIFTTIHD